MEVYRRNGILRYAAMHNDLSQLVLCTIVATNQYLTANCKKYLQTVGFKTAMALADFCKENEDVNFALLVLITVMLNHIHIHIHILIPEGDLHTHPHQAGDICRCVVYMALMKGEHGPHFIPLCELSAKEAQDMKKWINCTRPVENVPKSVSKPGQKFQSVQSQHDNDEPLDLSMPHDSKEQKPHQITQQGMFHWICMYLPAAVLVWQQQQAKQQARLQ